MKAYYNLYLAKVYELLKDGTTFNKQNNLFIKHYNTMDISEEEVRLNIGKDSNIKVLSYRFSNSRMQDAYEPILEWIRVLYHELIDEEIGLFLEHGNVYELHKPIIERFIKTGKCVRVEEVFIPEIEYDKYRFIASLINLLGYLSSKKPFILILNRLHFAAVSMIDFLDYYISSFELSRIVFIGTFNESYYIDKSILPKWKILINNLRKNSNIIDWDKKEKQELAVERTNFIPIISRYPRYLEKIENMLETLAIDQAYFYLDLLIHKIEIEKSNISISIQRSLLENFVKACIYKNEMNRASRICEKLRGLGEKNLYSLNNYEYYRLLTLTKTYSLQYEDGKRCAEILIDIAKTIGNEFYLFRAELTHFIAVNEGFKENVIRTSYNEASDKLFELAEKYNYKNMQAYLLVMSFDNNDNSTLSENEINYQEKMFNKGIEIAKELDNYYCQHVAYKKNVLMASFFGNYDAVSYYNEKCIDTLHIMQSPYEEAMLYNTMGYHSLINEDYEASNDYFYRAIQLLDVENRFNNICESLYNNGINAMRARDFESALDSFNTTMSIMKNLSLHRLSVCNVSKIYGLAAYCYYWTRDYYNLGLMLSKMERILSHILNSDDEFNYFLWFDDLFLYYFCNGLICIKEERYRLAQLRLDKAKEFMELAKGSIFLFYPMYAVVQARLYRLEGEEDLAVATLKKCMEFCEEKGYKDNYKNLEIFLQDNHQYEHSNIIQEQGYTYDQLIELSRREAISQELVKKNNNMDFLFTWQNVLSQQTDKEALINAALGVLQSNFNVDQVIYLTKDEGEFKVKYSYKQTTLTPKQIEEIKDKLEFETNGFAVARIERKVENYKDIISFFGYDNIWSFVCVPIVVNDIVTSILIVYNVIHTNVISNKAILTDDDIVIFKYAFRELTEVIEKIDAREKIIQINNELVKSSTTDGLTGAYNRQGFIKIVNELNEKLMFTGEHKNQNITILYIDLDNFKFYNDTFGHDIGDQVLKEITDLMKMTIGDKGYCSRFGGDEFVLLLIDSNEQDGEVVAKNIFHEIRKKNYFITLVEDSLDTKVNVDKNSKIGCSIGIADAKLFDTVDINDVLKRADQALYQVKNTTKRGYQSWSTLSYQ